MRLSIHANGGYDVVDLEEDGAVEGKFVEFVGFSLDPFSLFEVEKRFSQEGASVTDYRSPRKRALASEALAAVEAARMLVEYSMEHGGVEPEAVARAKDYATLCLKRATEENC